MLVSAMPLCDSPDTFCRPGGKAHRVGGQALDAGVGHAAVRQVERAQVGQPPQVPHRPVAHPAVLQEA
jgi:hypothetical protein